MGSHSVSRLGLQLFFADLLLTPLGLYLASRLRALLPYGQPLTPETAVPPLALYPLAVACWSASLVIAGAYDPQKVLRWYADLGRVSSGAVLATMVLAGVLYFTFRELSRLEAIYFLVINWSLLLGVRAMIRISFRATGHARPGWGVRVLIVGAGELGTRIAEILRARGRWGYQLVGFLDDDPAKVGSTMVGASVMGSVAEARQVVLKRKVDEVWVALPVRAYDRLSQLIAALEALPVRVKVVPDYFSLALVRAKADILGGMPLIGLREPVIEGIPRLVKRVFDVVVTLIVALPAAALVLLFAALIRLESSGLVLIRQKRVGENGRIFEMFKLRTMVVGAEAMQPPASEADDESEIAHKRRDDPRVTRVGRFLRRFSLDELPQLLNVLRGDLSLVGPRPELPWLVDRYQPWQRKRFAVPQGITGWWQINGRSEKPMHLNTEDDLYYVYNYSLWLDIQILLRTPFAVLQGKGAF